MEIVLVAEQWGKASLRTIGKIFADFDQMLMMMVIRKGETGTSTGGGTEGRGGATLRTKGRRLWEGKALPRLSLT